MKATIKPPKGTFQVLAKASFTGPNGPVRKGQKTFLHKLAAKSLESQGKVVILYHGSETERGELMRHLSAARRALAQQERSYLAAKEAVETIERELAKFDGPEKEDTPSPEPKPSDDKPEPEPQLAEVASMTKADIVEELGKRGRDGFSVGDKKSTLVAALEQARKQDGE